MLLNVLNIDPPSPNTIVYYSILRRHYYRLTSLCIHRQPLTSTTTTPRYHHYCRCVCVCVCECVCECVCVRVHTCVVERDEASVLLPAVTRTD